MADTNDPQKTRISLLEGIKDPENHRRWEQFYDKYSNMIRITACRSGLRSSEAEDLVQIVLIELSRKIGDYSYTPSKGKFRSWLKTVVRRRSIDYFRKCRPTEERNEHRSDNDNRDTATIDRQADSSVSNLDQFIDDEWNRAVIDNTLKAVRESVSPEQYQIYDAYVLKEWPVEKVQRVLGVSANRVYKAKSKIEKIVKQVMPRIAAEMDTPDIPPEHPTEGKS